MKAACIGCSRSPFAKPSIVMISSPTCITASVRHELMRLPFTSTVQAPHWPWSQPFLEPVRARCSRSASRSVVRESRFTANSRPLILSVNATVRGALGEAGAGADAPWPAAGADTPLAKNNVVAPPAFSTARRAGEAGSALSGSAMAFSVLLEPRTRLRLRARDQSGIALVRIPGHLPDALEAGNRLHVLRHASAHLAVGDRTAQ